MELSDKIIQNLTALAGGFLKGERATFNNKQMVELWADIVAAENYLSRPKEPAAQEHA